MGGKSLHASWISPYIPSNIKTYVEVFGGAMWIYWESNKVPVETNVYNDFNRHLVNVFACGSRDPAHFKEILESYYKDMHNPELFIEYRDEVFSIYGTDFNIPDFSLAAKYMLLQLQTYVDGNNLTKDSKIYISSGYGVGCKMIRLEKGGKAEEEYSNDTIINHHGGVILIGDHLYGHSDRGGWKCQNFATGEELWRSKDLGKGAIHYADGMLYCLGESDGTIALVKASPKGWLESSRFKLSPQTQLRKPSGKIWTHPVVIGGQLYLRDQEIIYCYNVKS